MAPAARGRRSRHRARTALLVSAVLIAVVAALIARNGDPVRGGVYGLLALGAVSAVGLLGRRAPGPAVAAAAVLSTSATVLASTAGAAFPTPPFALFPFAIAVVLAMIRGAAVWAVASVGAAYVASVTAVLVSATTTQAVQGARGVGAMLIVLVALGAGAFLRNRRTRLEEDRRRQADQQRAAIEEERLRIARELHDVLAHSLSSITVQAGVGLHLAKDRPAAATEALETIRTASKEALDEVRGVLGLLRGDEAAPLAPGPDLDAIAVLVAETRSAGARITLDDRLQPRPARPVQLAVYRVVQEALTNARRHAPGAAVEVVLDAEPGWVVAAVSDHRPGAAPPMPVAGNGITGMRERAAALGGTLDTRTSDDGLEVLLRIPVPRTESLR